LPYGFAVTYNFSILLTCGFAFGHARPCFHVVHARHLALKGLINLFLTNQKLQLSTTKKQMPWPVT